jgi:hypothetical protein
MASPSNPQTFTFLELTPPLPTKPTTTPTTKSSARKTPIITKGGRMLPSKVTKKSSALVIERNKRALLRIISDRDWAPVFRTVTAAKAFGATLKKGDDEAKEATWDEIEQDNKQAEERAKAEDFPDELPEGLSERHLECEYPSLKSHRQRC